MPMPTLTPTPYGFDCEGIKSVKPEEFEAEVHREMIRLQAIQQVQNSMNAVGTLFTPGELVPIKDMSVASLKISKEEDAPPIKRKTRTEEVREQHKIRWWLHALGALLIAICADAVIQIGRHEVSKLVPMVTNEVPAVKAEEEVQDMSLHTIPVYHTNYFGYVFTNTIYTNHAVLIYYKR